MFQSSKLALSFERRVGLEALSLSFERRFGLEALLGFEDRFEEELGDGSSSDREGASWSWSDGEAGGNVV
jgi:hypothetical protein